MNFLEVLGVLGKIILLIFSAVFDNNKQKAAEKGKAASMLAEGLAEKDKTKIGAAWDRIRRLK